ncbi:MAG TPA: Lrp/AsnC family transcriptional regulator [Burkholderiaceae bacterium]|nr:Lrp/AsnC family transcriptional regulator [Burkholderiaceae bacterium]
MVTRDELRRSLLNDWQRGFPLVAAPFERIAAALRCSEAAVLEAYQVLRTEGSVSRIGGVFAAGAGGAGLLAAVAVPPARLAAVAALVSAHPGVNHNYEREHRWNLWFVLNGSSAAAVQRTMDALEAVVQLPTLRLPMQRAYRIDLGFDLDGLIARSPTGNRAEAAAPLVAADWPLAALVEQGLPLVRRPYDLWALQLGCDGDRIVETLARWQHDGTLKRFGVIVRHHELGFDANAMTVFDVPDDEVDARGLALARDAAVTLAYRRERAVGWPYNLYCMVHGRDRVAVRATLDGVIERAGLAACGRETLFSRRRFKQEGARRFRDLDALASHAH